MNKKSKKPLIIALIIVAVLIIGGVVAFLFLTGKDDDSTNSQEDDVVQVENTSTDSSKQAETETSKSPTTVDEVISALKAAGMAVGEKSQKAYEMIYANDGASVDVDGTAVEIYSYNDNSGPEKGIQALEDMSVQYGIPSTSTNLTNGNILIVVQSQDQAFVDKIKAATE